MKRAEGEFLGKYKSQGGMNKDTVFEENGGWVVRVGMGER